MELIFVRHAQPAWAQDGRSVIDPPLTELGRRQAERLAERCAAWPRPTAIYVSPTLRARQTAAPVCARLGVEPAVLPWFAEIRLPPHWDGAPVEVVTEALHRARLRSAEEWWEGLPGGESFHAFHERICDNLLPTLRGHGVTPRPGPGPRTWDVAEPGRRLLFFGHGGSNAVALALLLGLGPVPWEWERFVSLHASITRLKTAPLLGAHLFGLRSHSDVSHLPEELHTR